MILDEATSALDVETERAILADLFDLLKERINFHPLKLILAVTHRGHDLARFDEILFFEKGRIVQKGHYSDLVENPDFAHFFEG